MQQFIRSYAEKPHVILLQETLTGCVALPGYQFVAKHEEGRGVGVLISKKLTHVTHDLRMATNKIEYIMTEIIPGPVSKESIFILNVYSSPKDLRQRFKTLVSRAVQLAKDSPLLLRATLTLRITPGAIRTTRTKGRTSGERRSTGT